MIHRELAFECRLESLPGLRGGFVCLCLLRLSKLWTTRVVPKKSVVDMVFLLLLFETNVAESVCIQHEDIAIDIQPVFRIEAFHHIVIIIGIFSSHDGIVTVMFELFKAFVLGSAKDIVSNCFLALAESNFTCIW
jgi:hypothetical protein